ncbi:anthranilate phosphoribosyltransferase [Dehalobacterium formicoaceticum]|uniref:Anthranilate phosphoribosyltransferase n=1 Tax=Dehalobacterium formicoaceticum TaxID=51515 RepID=A0ABT1Y4B6_9FIRM|nr:anthranilate phosphoribosyltransferase [Dehalobacterium formicoaceticum]MCR6545722.1 anthranilate phosphoribosyltransferase [Dehalobacterium formicoaceticum]
MSVMHMDMREFGAGIAQLINKENLSRSKAKDMFVQVLMNQQPDLQQGAFLSALTAKGETAEEIAGSWEAIYELDTVKVNPDISGDLVENSGTGMDSMKTFNISTAAAIIAAAGGVTMAKHGSRAITSSCGTIDLLEELGIEMECEADLVKNSIEKAGIGIFNGMSSKVHPQALGRILSQIAFGTTLNIAASLANPAAPKYAVRGVYDRELVLPVAEVMKEIGFKRAIVLFGMDGTGPKGMDEASTIGETYIAELKENGEIIQYTLTPEEFGISRPDKKELSPYGNRRDEALRLLSILSGKGTQACTDIVCLNAGLILYIFNKTQSIKDGFYLAGEIIRTNRGIDKLQEWVEAQNADPSQGLKKLNSLLETV